MEKKRIRSKLATEIYNSRCIYNSTPNETLFEIINKFKNGDLDVYHFILEMQKKYSILFDLKKLLNQRSLASILIEPNSVKICLKENGLQFSIDSSSRSALFEILNFGSYEKDEMQMIQNFLGSHDIFFDVGSHVGWYSINLAKQNKNAKFYAFEPIVDTYNLLNENILNNQLGNVESFNFGFSDKKRVADFYFSEIGSPVASEKDIFDIHTLNTVKCRLEKIDTFIKKRNLTKIDFIKCDVEGSEYLVIKGGENSIRKFLPILFLELVEDWCNKFNYTTFDLINFLYSIGYKMFEIKGKALYSIDNISADKIDNFNYLFLHKNKHGHFIDAFAFN